jgi:hypothetical protein
MIGGAVLGITVEQVKRSDTTETSDSPAMRARDVCHAIGLGTEHKDTEGVRAKLKRLVSTGS